jgi:hypothetical protein
MSISYGDDALAHLRSLIAVVDREFATTAPSAELRVAWTKILEILALGPAPELRECPTCNGVGMRAATRCSRCWSALPPFALAASSPLALPVASTGP